MNRHFSVLLASAMLCSCLCGTTAFAVENTSASETTVVSETNSIQPRGSLSGYGSVWHNAGTSTSGNFYVNVTGIGWPTAQVTFSIENFGSNDAVAVQLYRPDGTFAWGSVDNAGDYITMANTGKWHNITFANGQTGTYRVHYSIINWNGNTPSSGRINCWIY